MVPNQDLRYHYSELRWLSWKIRHSYYVFYIYNNVTKCFEWTRVSSDGLSNGWNSERRLLMNPGLGWLTLRFYLNSIVLVLWWVILAEISKILLHHDLNTGLSQQSYYTQLCCNRIPVPQKWLTGSKIYVWRQRAMGLLFTQGRGVNEVWMTHSLHT